MPVTEFAVTWDYRCPFARNAHEHLAAALRGGAPWQVEFLPFSLSQVHVPEGGTDVWDDPAKAPDLLAMQAGIAVQELDPDRFLDVHLALFAARHDRARDLRDPDVVRDAVASAGVDADAVMAAVADGWTLEAFRKRHEAAAADHQVWGVPTFIVGDRAAFARVMTRPDGDPDRSRATIERILSTLADWPELNEIKHTSLAR